MEKITLYHGSNVEVGKPIIVQSKRLLDFGTGFYLTSDYKQAQRWADRTANRRQEGNPAISVFSIEKKNLEKFKLLIFEAADKEWLEYVSRNRTDKSTGDTYDIVIGPVANDQAIRTINDYLKGRFTSDIAIQLLLPQKLKDQYVFKTEKALSALKFEEVKWI